MHSFSSRGLQVRVLGVPQQNAKSRVETQVKICLQLVTDKGDKVPLWSHLSLPEYLVPKEKLRRFRNGERSLSANADGGRSILHLEASVVCASDVTKSVGPCMGCIQRERKRARKKEITSSKKLVKQETGQPADVATNAEESLDEESLSLEQRKIVLFNCAEMVDFSSGDTILPTRITCYCRHHGEKLGFCIYFIVKDHTGQIMATGISPPIMITDDHKSTKAKPHVSRKRQRFDSTATAAGYAGRLSVCGSRYALSARLDLTVLPQTLPSSGSIVNPPAINKLIPAEGPVHGGLEITILGSGFYDGMTVMFGAIPATRTQFWSETTLVCTLPPAPAPGVVPVLLRESQQLMNSEDNSDVVFTYKDDSDRALMELALQVLGLRMTGKLEDARQIAMRIVSDPTGNAGASGTAAGNGDLRGADLERLILQNLCESELCATSGTRTSTQHSILLQECRRVRTPKTQHTLLHLAVFARMSSLAKWLVANKLVDVDAVDASGFSALHLAAWMGLWSVARALLEGKGVVSSVFASFRGINGIVRCSRTELTDVMPS
ncbi:uncharacterized protein EV422DRAFT_501642 [Fimicolochytrium jonesii]|uniref:uncharacterized protein n=1 Tax=Fimicolochytrium jonesii TaxID=1396493 RepID=UPI0022FEE167|nr:uncharacterized protein EV422DRAFT_501642 [Fimicolochytrium jonesii]KAI8816046.1 hypothetical protein EV422DRAFT_501642 [Fimicolochytrium jonesii]